MRLWYLLCALWDGICDLWDDILEAPLLFITSAVFLVVLILALVYSAKLEKAHPCVEYGPEYTVIYWNKIGDGLYPTTYQTRDCLKRKP